MNVILNEDSRKNLLANVKSSRNYVPSNQYRGKNRFYRRLSSKLESSVKKFNTINMDKFFKSDILDVSIDVTGETDLYVVRISFQGTLEEIHSLLNSSDSMRLNNIVDRRTISRALTRAFNNNDVYVNCTCPDFHYRHKYWATKNNLLIGEPESRPNRFDWTNSNNDMGDVCKHVALSLSDSSWLIKVSSVIYNYINYMKSNNERLYEKFIFPALYQIPYDDEQIDLEDELVPDDVDVDAIQELIDAEMEADGKLSVNTRNLIDKSGMSLRKQGDTYVLKGVPIVTDPDEIKKINDEARKRGQFKKGNVFRFTSEKPKQFSFDDLLTDEEESEEQVDSES